MIKYHLAPDVEKSVHEIIRKLGLRHSNDEILCLRSHGSKAKKSFARTYKLSKENKVAIGVKALYAVEVISENFDRLTAAAKIKTLIHELLHIAKKPADGFHTHKEVSRARVEELYKRLH